MRKVALVLGGKSAEREISLRTGEQVGVALKRKGHEVISLDLDDGLVPALQREKPDVVFIALHGRYGEDGCLQGLLEIMGIPYVGSGVLASALAMDKIMSKKLFRLEGLTCPRGIAVTRDDMRRTGEYGLAQEVQETLGFPVIVKPCREGSTIGLSLVKEPGSLHGALEHAFEYDSDVLVEEYVKGTEITVGVLGNREPRALPVIEIVSATGLYDYEAKYTKGLSEHIIPARIPDDAYAAAQDAAVRAHKAMGCRGMSRADFMVDPGGVPYILEVNTIPGMTETSLLPDAARAAGIDFPELVDMLIELALETPKGEPPVGVRF
ncbi:MAG: D-alanine--D-alanine ligase [Firmicutes bacterium]|jgi:D-alanine-D-alanine ligase|nr:D-alanine--D-alanine ligase [Bacillota bacterium]MDH7495568.1 D-alanine--D-alanine ligase [Bacillota bacterium]